MAVQMVMLGKTFGPADADWFVPSSEEIFFYGGGVALAPDKFVVAAVLNGDRYSFGEPYTRTFRYRAGKWLCVELIATVADMCPWREAGAAHDGVAMLFQHAEC